MVLARLKHLCSLVSIPKALRLHAIARWKQQGFNISSKLAWAVGLQQCRREYAKSYKAVITVVSKIKAAHLHGF